MVGAKIGFPGPHLDGKSLYELFESEKVTFSAGVPTVWQGLLAYMEANDLKFSTMNRTVIGGSACPPAMIKAVSGQVRRRRTARVGHDRDESRSGTACTSRTSTPICHAEQRLPVHKQGRALFGVDMKIVVTMAGLAMGRRCIRQPAGARAVGRARLLQQASAVLW